MYKKLSTTQKIVNKLNSGRNVTWSYLKTKVKSIRKLIDSLRVSGMCIYRNDTTDGVAYRVNRPSRGMIVVGCVLWVLLLINFFGNTGGLVSN